MKEQGILESNYLIGKFLGWVISKRGRKFKNHLPPYGYVKAHPNHLKFHLSWDWLILAIEEIESLGYDFSIDNCYVRIWDSGLSNFEMEFSEPTKLMTAHKAVVEFIKWYNKKHKNGNHNE